MTVYKWQRFELVAHDDGRVITNYSGGYWSGCAPVIEDEFHAQKLGITAREHRLHHELAHHLIGLARGHDAGSPIIWRDAHHKPQPTRDAELEEWEVTALQYAERGRKFDRGAFMDLERDGINTEELRARLKWLTEAPKNGALYISMTR